jgi:hypothetical protein
MQKKVSIIALAAIITLTMALPVMAQTNSTTSSLGTLSSNTSAATAGIFKNDVDNFINYHKYSGVLKDDAKWFGFVTGRTNAGGVLDIGYASNLGSLYLGTWYRGNIYKVNNATVTNSITPSYNNDRELLTGTTETTSYSGIKWEESANQVEFLIGVAGQGIKVGFLESLASDLNAGNSSRNFTVTDYQNGRVEYSGEVIEYQRNQGYLKPYLGWGTNIAIGDMKLMPYVDLGLVIYNNTLIDNYQSYTTINGAKQNVENVIGAGNNSGYLLPYGTVGAKLDLAKKNTVQTTVELKYGLEMTLYNNDAGLLGSVDGTVNWNDGYIDRVTEYTDRTETTTNMYYNINEQASVSHVITPIYKITGEPAENFKMGFQASLPISFGSQSGDSYSKRIQKTTTKYKWDNLGTVREQDYTGYNSSIEISNLSINLNLAMGTSYQLIPGRFGINAGILATPVRYSHSETKNLPHNESSISTDKTTQDDGKVISNTKTVNISTQADSVRVSDTWSQYSGALYGGFIFNFNSNAALDLVCAYSGSADFTLALDYVNVIFTFKF